MYLYPSLSQWALGPLWCVLFSGISYLLRTVLSISPRIYFLQYQTPPYFSVFFYFVFFLLPCSYGRVEELVYFANLKEQYEIVVHHYIQVKGVISFLFLIDPRKYNILLRLVQFTL